MDTQHKQEQLAALKKALAKKKHKLEKADRLRQLKELRRQKISDLQNNSALDYADNSDSCRNVSIIDVQTGVENGEQKSKRSCVSFKLTPLSIHGNLTQEETVYSVEEALSEELSTSSHLVFSSKSAPVDQVQDLEMTILDSNSSLVGDCCLNSRPKPVKLQVLSSPDETTENRVETIALHFKPETDVVQLMSDGRNKINVGPSGDAGIYEIGDIISEKHESRFEPLHETKTLSQNEPGCGNSVNNEQYKDDLDESLSKLSCITADDLATHEIQSLVHVVTSNYTAPEVIDYIKINSYSDSPVGLDDHIVVDNEKHVSVVLCYGKKGLSVYQKCNQSLEYNQQYTWTTKNNDVLFFVRFLRRSTDICLLVVSSTEEYLTASTSSSNNLSTNAIAISVLKFASNTTSDSFVIDRFASIDQRQPVILSDREFCLARCDPSPHVHKWTVVSYTLNSSCQYLLKSQTLAGRVSSLACMGKVNEFDNTLPTSCVCGIGDHAIFLWNHRSGVLLRKIPAEITIMDCASIVSEQGLLFIPCLVTGEEFPGCLLAVNPLSGRTCIVNRWSSTAFQSSDKFGHVAICHDRIIGVKETGAVYQWSLYTGALLKKYSHSSDCVKNVRIGGDHVFILLQDRINIVAFGDIL